MEIRRFRNLAPEGLGGLIAIMFGGGRETISPAAIDDDTLPAAFRAHFAHFIAAEIRELERRRLRTLKALLLRLWVYPFFRDAALCGGGIFGCNVVESGSAFVFHVADYRDDDLHIWFFRRLVFRSYTTGELS